MCAREREREGGERKVYMCISTLMQEPMTYPSETGIKWVTPSPASTTVPVRVRSVTWLELRKRETQHSDYLKGCQHVIKKKKKKKKSERWHRDGGAAVPVSVRSVTWLELWEREEEDCQHMIVIIIVIIIIIIIITIDWDHMGHSVARVDHRPSQGALGHLVRSAEKRRQTIGT